MADASDLPSSGNTPELNPLTAWLSKVVVLDTQGPLIYIGILAATSPLSLLLLDADVHDSNDARSSKDLYILECRELGVRANRSRVLVNRHAVISISLLDDVIS